MESRETKAFEILARENARMLSVYLRSLIGDEATVDDLFQETMIVAWRRLDDCDLSQPFGPWLRGIASRQVMAYYRKRKQQPVFLNDAVLAHVDRHFEAIRSQVGDTWDEKVSALHDCIKQLPEGHRDVIRSRYIDDQSTPQIAERFQISTEACKKRLQRARTQLADCLKRKDVLLTGRGTS